MNWSVIFIILFLLMFFLCKISETCKFYIILFCYGLAFFFVPILMLPIVILRPGNIDNLSVLAKLGNLLSPLFGLKYIIEGAENFEKHASFIVAANHQCIFDVYGMAACSSYLKNCTIISKQEISWCGVNGIIGWLSGVIFIKRVYSPETQRKLEEALKKLKEKKFKIWFFPEGYCRNTGEIHPFKKGAFYFAVKAEIPIVPIVFSQAKWFDKVNKRFTGATIILRVLPPVETRKMYNFDNMDKLIETVRNQMITNFKDLQKVV